KQGASVPSVRRNIRKHQQIISLSLLSFIVLCLLNCGPQKDTIPVGSEDVITEPRQEFGDAAFFFYENGVKRWRLDADYMSRPLADTGKLVVVPVRIMVYDTLGKPSTRIVADSGSTDSKMEKFDLWGGVFIKTEEGMTVKSEQLRWFKEKRKVTSDTYVQIETPKGDLLRGKGLDATDDFSRFSFKADVRGKFPDFKRRLEEEDDFLKF
ncbi:MAG: LPS export ABC transporter periplasmic protein LptC, partial [Chitinispirillales bacterium]|nr:LPS export ABC transporter periplasmic protein LptC [Chitinispirillales bacterium]